MARRSVDISDLIAKLPAVEKMVDKAVLDVTTKITLDVGRNVIIGSPVDDGDFRAAWEIEEPKKPYEAGTVTNNTVYGPPLAHGHSPQAEDGWILNAVIAAVKVGGKE